ncbi:MAG: KEOPS complex subunit Cgi121 [Candidatus Hydrothermarchaeales archaeon]
MNILSLRSKKPLNREILEDYRDIQLVDSRLVAGLEHIEFAVSQAEKAFERNENISNDLLIEVMVRMSGQRQINKAFEMFGLKDSTEVVLISKKDPRNFLKANGWVKDKSILDIDKEKFDRIRAAFHIGEKEIEAASNEDRIATLVDIVKERVALVSVI